MNKIHNSVFSVVMTDSIKTQSTHEMFDTQYDTCRPDGARDEAKSRLARCFVSLLEEKQINNQKK